MVLNAVRHLALIALVALLAVAPVLGAPRTFANTLDGNTACVLINAKVYTMTGAHTLGLIDPGYVALDAHGKIASVGKMSAAPRDLPALDCLGMVLTPGLIDADTILGLSGHPVIGITQEQNEGSDRNLAQLRVTDGFNPLDKALPRVRAAGITTVYVNPGENSLITGQGALLKLRPSPAVEDLILKSPAGVHISLGEEPKGSWGGKGGPSTRMGTAALLRSELIGARNWLASQAKYHREVAAYDKKVAAGTATNDDGEPLEPPAPPDRDLKKEALAQVLHRTVPVIVRAHRADDILTALRIAEEFDLDLILLHATAAWQVLPELTAANTRLLLGPVRTGPNSMETLAARIDNARLVAAAGLPFAIQTGDALGARALAHEAAWAQSGGLSPTEALLAITRYPAEIFGVADRVGSLAPGLDADLVVWTIDPLLTNTLARYVVIDGELVNDSDEMLPFPAGRDW